MTYRTKRCAVGSHVTLVAGHPLWPVPLTAAARHHHPLDHGLEELGFVPLTGRDVNPQEDAVILADQVDLGAEAALRVAQRMVRRLLQLRRLGPGQDAGSARFFGSSGRSARGA